MTNDNELVNSLYGSKIEKRKACAYCYYHKAHITPKMLKQHECLKKQCNRLKKNEEHDLWRQREVMKQKRKDRKEKYTI